MKSPLKFYWYRILRVNIQVQRQLYKPGHQTPSKNPYPTFTDTKTRRPCQRNAFLLTCRIPSTHGLRAIFAPETCMIY